MQSLSFRLSLAAGIVLALFLGLTAWALDRAFRDTAERMVHDRLQAQIYGLLAAADLDPDGSIDMPPTLPEERFQRPDSGLYAQIQDSMNEIVWRSPSLVLTDMPTAPVLAPGQWRFMRVDNQGDEEQWFLLALGIAWELEDKSLDFTFSIAEEPNTFRAQLNRFRNSLWGWFAALAAGLLLTLVLVLRWGLSPLRHAERELKAIERGEQEGISGQYPRELRGLTDNLNALLGTERERLRRYRDGLADLAHSLKTPLAILRGVGTTAEPPEERDATIREQTERMGQIVDYQLQRAALSGRSALMKPVELKPLLMRIQVALSKVYGNRDIVCEWQLDAQVQVRADEADLLELLGNVLDNAFKWASSRVLIRVDTRRESVRIVVEDDGPGIPEAQRGAVLNRGVRMDSTTPGQGIGLAVARDIAQAYGGDIEIHASETLRGASIQISLACS